MVPASTIHSWLSFARHDRGADTAPGFIDAFVNGPATNASMAIVPPTANPAVIVSSLTPVDTLMTTNIRMAVITNSTAIAETTGKVVVVAPNIASSIPSTDRIAAAATNRGYHLCQAKGGRVLDRESSVHGKSDRHRGIDMCAADSTQRIDHHHDYQPPHCGDTHMCQRAGSLVDSHRAAPDQDETKRPNEFGETTTG